MRSSRIGTRTLVHVSSPHTAVPFTLKTVPEERDDRLVRMLMFGKPGAGKGTLTAWLAKKYDILTLSTGDLLRQHIAERTVIGAEAEAIIAKGGLVPDEVVLKVVTSKLTALQNKHWILDGFPRTCRQGQLLDEHLKKRNMPLTLVVNIDVPDNVILSRISERRVHLPSGRVYSMSFNRPCVDGFDDQTGEPLTRRPDDDPEVFARRLEAFYQSTSPLLSYYSRASALYNTPSTTEQHPHQLSLHHPPGLKVKTLKGTTSDEIWPQLDRLIQNSFPRLRERPEPRMTRLLGCCDAAINISISGYKR